MVKRLRLRFAGADGSLGFRVGQVYDLEVRVGRLGPTILAPTPCPYSSWITFWRNWETGA